MLRLKACTKKSSFLHQWASWFKHWQVVTLVASSNSTRLKKLFTSLHSIFTTPRHENAFFNSYLKQGSWSWSTDVGPEATPLIYSLTTDAVVLCTHAFQLRQVMVGCSTIATHQVKGLHVQIFSSARIKMQSIYFLHKKKLGDDQTWGFYPNFYHAFTKEFSQVHILCWSAIEA